MELTDNDLMFLEARISGTLSETEQKDLEKRLTGDAAFRKEAEAYCAVIKSLKILGDNKTKDFLRGIDKTMLPLPTSDNKVSRFKFFLKIAATFLILFTGWYFAERAQKPKLSEAVAAAFEPYPSDYRTKGEEKKDAQTLAFQAYDAQHFNAAVPLFEKAFSEHVDTLLLFYRGIAQLGGGESLAAKTSLEKLQGSQIVPQEVLPFYLGLVYLETGEKEKARAQLTKIAETEGAYRDKAIQALKFLGNRK